MSRSVAVIAPMRILAAAAYGRGMSTQNPEVAPAMLAAGDLEKTFGTGSAAVAALRSVDVTVDAGELVAVVGPSACGKSTLLSLLAGLERPDGGWIELGDERVDGLGEQGWSLRRRRRIGFVFQSFNLLATLTAAENVELPALLAGRSRRNARRCRIELFERLGLADRAGALPSQLSGGEQQRIAIARAVVNDPALLLADEPTGNLDSTSRDEVLALVRSLHDDGQTIVLVTHDPLVAAIAERVLAMHDGRIVSEVSLRGEPDRPSVVDALMRETA
jgi:putative ABC transport system ATP-binding protein